MAKELSAVEVNRLLKRPVLGRHRVSKNLYLQVRGENTGSWLFRYMTNGKPHHLGLGRVDLFSLAEARQRAKVCGQQLTDKIDPLAAKRRRVTVEKIEAAKNITFGECARRYIKAHAPEWKNEKHDQQWRNTFEGSNRRPAPTAAINALPVGSIDTTLAMEVLQEIWTKTPETASRVRQRCEAVIDWATASKYRSGANPFAWRGNLQPLLAKLSPLKKLKGRGPLPALPYTEMPAFMGELHAKEFMSARALQFTILTAARTDEVLNAPWSEFDLTAKTWTVPAARMKGGKTHRVPLCERALQILAELPRDGCYVFPGRREGQPLGRMAMLDLMKVMRPEFVPHGFRATFRTWCAERTNYPQHVCEAALAHESGDKVERSYQRSDLFDKRRELMQAWSDFCMSPPVDTAAGTVTPIRRRAS